MDALKELNHEAGPSAGDDALRRVADRLLQLALAGRPGGAGRQRRVRRAGVVPEPRQASELSARLEWILSSQGTKATFGWAGHPQEARTRSRPRAASERLYARKVMRGYVRGQQPQRPRAVS